jgi:hypothetical protein
VFINPPSESSRLEDLLEWCQKLQQQIIVDDLKGSGTWDPGSIADGNEAAASVTVTGAELGDYAIASFSLDVQDLALNAQVTATDTVTCTLLNNTGGAIDLDSGTLYVRVFRRTT